MNYLRGILADLRERRLLPVAVVFAVALVALPVLLHKSPDSDSAAAPTAVTTTGAPGTAPGQTLVTLAALRTDSSLDTFDTKNPFRSLRPVPALTSPELLGSAPSSGGSSSGGSPSGGGSGGGDTGGFALPPTSPIAPPTSPPGDGGDDPTDNGNDDDDPTVTKTVFTHEVDLAFGTPSKVRRIRGIPRLSMLPSAQDPMLVFLGVDPSATKAVFLVDARLTQSGEGKCRDATCAFIELGVGNVHGFTDQDGTRYVVRLDQIRRVAVRAAASRLPPPSAEPLDETAGADAGSETGAAGTLVRRFMLPLFGDVVEVEVQR